MDTVVLVRDLVGYVFLVVAILAGTILVSAIAVGITNVICLEMVKSWRNAQAQWRKEAERAKAEQ